MRSSSVLRVLQTENEIPLKVLSQKAWTKSDVRGCVTVPAGVGQGRAMPGKQQDAVTGVNC